MENIIKNCECCGRDVVMALDNPSKTAICIKCRDVFSKSKANEEIDILHIIPQKYKCPKCHTKFTRIYPYKPSDTKEIK